MQRVCLERRTPDTYEQVLLFDTYLSHYVEGDGYSRNTTYSYSALGLTREKCVKQYLDQGFMEVQHELR